MEYKIKEDVLKAILSYLAAKPFSEVANLIGALQSSEKIEETPIKKK